MSALAWPTLEQQKILTKWRTSTFWVMLVGYVGYYLCRSNISAALPLLGTTFNFSNTELGMMITFSELTYAMGKFINGPLADRIGGKRIFILENTDRPSCRRFRIRRINGQNSRASRVRRDTVRDAFTVQHDLLPGLRGGNVRGECPGHA